MADTRVQLEVEDWVRENWMPNEFQMPFHRKRLKLSSGGVFDFDAVSVDGSVVASISTSAATTSAGKYGTGKMMKLRSDMLFLLMTEGPARRAIVLTEPCMYANCEKERSAGRVPLEVEFLLAQIPLELEKRLIEARQRASKEVSPGAALSGIPDTELLKPSD